MSRMLKMLQFHCLPFDARALDVSLGDGQDRMIGERETSLRPLFPLMESEWIFEQGFRTAFWFLAFVLLLMQLDQRVTAIG